MKRSLPIFGIDLVYDEIERLVLAKSNGKVINVEHARDRKQAKRVMTQMENDFHSIARGMEA
jgi:GTP:adenosylcobinamide-phosphate guanylyltransferase